MDRGSLLQRLGPQWEPSGSPSKGTLFRALLTLNAEGRIATVSTSVGGTDTTRHRKLAPPD